MRSDYKKKINAFEQLYKGNARFIDRTRPDKKNSPHVFTMDDYEQIITTNEGICFARKFSEDKDIEIVKKIHDYVKSGEQAKK